MALLVFKTMVGLNKVLGGFDSHPLPPIHNGPQLKGTLDPECFVRCLSIKPGAKYAPVMKAFEPFRRLRSGLDCLNLGIGFNSRYPFMDCSGEMLAAFPLELGIRMQHIVARVADETKGLERWPSG